MATSRTLFGLDHILAMVAVGMWAASLGGHLLLVVPLAFVSMMMLGFVLPMTGVELPFAEPVIAASVVVIGLVLIVALRVSSMVGMLTVGAFALFHGYAHGDELGLADASFFITGCGDCVAPWGGSRDWDQGIKRHDSSNGASPCEDRRRPDRAGRDADFRRRLSCWQVCKID